MALPTIEADDFKGWLKIVANSFKTEYLEEYITLFRAKYIRDILGDAAYIDIDSKDLLKWTDLIEGVNYVDSEGKLKVHSGLVDSIKRFIYFQFVRDNFTPTQAGNVRGGFENSTRSTGAVTAGIARTRYNQGVMLMDPFCDFLEANKELEAFVSSFVDNGDNTYTLMVDNTKYLYAGDNVSLLGNDYTVSNVIENTSITIDYDGVLLDIDGDSLTWSPYDIVDYTPIDICGL